MPLSNLPQKVSTDNRILQVAVVVGAVAIAGRFLDPSFQVVKYAGLLSGVMNAPRTDSAEYASKFAGLPAAYGGVLLTLALLASVALGAYSFPVETVWGWLFSILGPMVEAFVFIPLYFVEGVVAFVVVKRLPGVPTTQSG